MIRPARPLPIDTPEAAGPIPPETAEIIAALLLDAVDQQGEAERTEDGEEDTRGT